MITWTYKGKEYWESYCYYPYKGISVSIRAYTNGKYMILNNGQIILSGNKINREEAIKALNDYLYPVIDVIEEKDTGISLNEEEVIDTLEVTEKDEEKFEILRAAAGRKPHRGPAGDALGHDFQVSPLAQQGKAVRIPGGHAFFARPVGIDPLHHAYRLSKK